MTNYKPGKGKKRKFDEWYYYDQLPCNLKKSLQESLLPWSASSALRSYRAHLKVSNSQLEAVFKTVQELRVYDSLESVKQGNINRKNRIRERPTEFSVLYANW